MINVSVTKGGSENVSSLIRRFSKRVQGSGVVRKVKSTRFHQRAVSKTKRRVSALRRIDKAKKREELMRLGLYTPRKRGR
jgi:ribosomal protein S21